MSWTKPTSCLVQEYAVARLSEYDDRCRKARAMIVHRAALVAGTVLTIAICCCFAFSFEGDTQACPALYCLNCGRYQHTSAFLCNTLDADIRAVHAVVPLMPCSAMPVITGAPSEMCAACRFRY